MKRDGYKIGSLHSARESYNANMFQALLQLAKSDGDSIQLQHKSKQLPQHNLEMNIAAIEKQGYKHFMLKEVMEQPRVLENCMRGRIDASKNLSFRWFS